MWALGITLIELLDGEPPHADVHPLRALFLIPNAPPPSLRDASAVSPAFVDFLSACLRKEAGARPSARDLCEHEWVRPAVARM